jgi:hypothetical protein
MNAAAENTTEAKPSLETADILDGMIAFARNELAKADTKDPTVSWWRGNLQGLVTARALMPNAEQRAKQRAEFAEFAAQCFNRTDANSSTP